MSNTSIRISDLNDFTSVVSTDFEPLVDSSSLTTFRTSLSSLGTFIANNVGVNSASYASHSFTSDSSSWASSSFSSVSASYAKTASYAVSASNAISSSYSLTSSFSSRTISSSYANTASFIVSSSSSTTSSYSVSSSISVSSSYSRTSSYANTASYAVTSSYANTSSYSVTASYAANIANANTGINYLTTPVIVATTQAYGYSPYYQWFRDLPSFNYQSASVADSFTIGLNLADSNQGPTKFNTSLIGGIPANIKCVILEASAMGTWADFQVANPTYIFIRKNMASADLLLLSITRGDNGNAGQSSSGQGMFPVDSDGSFYWSKKTIGLSGGMNMGYIIRLIGYIV